MDREIEKAHIWFKYHFMSEWFQLIFIQKCLHSTSSFHHLCLILFYIFIPDTNSRRPHPLSLSHLNSILLI